MAEEKKVSANSKFLNADKLERAQAVIAGSRSFANEKDNMSVEVSSLGFCQKQDLKGEELLVCVYKRIGGAIVADVVKKDMEPGVVSSKTSGKEKQVIPPKGK